MCKEIEHLYVLRNEMVTNKSQPTDTVAVLCAFFWCDIQVCYYYVCASPRLKVAFIGQAASKKRWHFLRTPQRPRPSNASCFPWNIGSM